MTNDLKKLIHNLADRMCFCDTNDEDRDDENRVIWEPLENLNQNKVEEIVDDFANSIERFIHANYMEIANHYRSPTANKIKQMQHHAPAMLHILKEALAYMQNYQKCDNKNLLEDIQKTINKAEGKR